mmetsp:Transcript_12182/g.27876  ORF Transcript_12182/g.27876 Transcript_12182/m.27876 type:complete len:281 (-) Transcript_12182:106-948(-)
MNDYSKWDKIQDSDEEEESKQRAAESIGNEETERFRQDQEMVDQWLRKQAAQLTRGEEPSRPPELKEQAPFRKVTKEERKVLSMLIVLSHFDEGKTNLDRHPHLLELVRHNRWLEEDNTLELLCRVHTQAMRSGEKGTSAAKIQESPEEVRLRNMCLGGINTLAGPKRAKCPGGLLELVTMICTPTTEQARELRVKWQKKEFAKDAIFRSLFPDMAKFDDADQEEDSGGMKEVWICLALLLILFIVVLLIFYGPSMPSFGRSASPAPPPTASVVPDRGEL